MSVARPSRRARLRSGDRRWQGRRLGQRRSKRALRARPNRRRVSTGPQLRDGHGHGSRHAVSRRRSSGALVIGRGPAAIGSCRPRIVSRPSISCAPANASQGSHRSGSVPQLSSRRTSSSRRAIASCGRVQASRPRSLAVRRRASLSTSRTTNRHPIRISSDAVLEPFDRATYKTAFTCLQPTRLRPAR
jgi:hypothetical protein